MKLKIIAVGQKMPKWVEEAYAEYEKRMPPEIQVSLHEVKPEPRTSGKTAKQMMAAEAIRIESAISSDAWVVALDEHGKDLTTVSLSKRLSEWMNEKPEVVLLIGGPDGLDEVLKSKSNEKLRLSSLTLPHPMVRVLLIEQLYRAWSILNNHPYHRA
ncbi:ribosomal RNA large subunit methyltransferase H [Taylorella asinigenitalis 14/45]|uniref:Ribosomal RNA large subunit methyltransferase H n=1 Tax=Taylorella asinigenitalis 14/45 TaxID=1091495 RepID=I7ILC5_9BURK|nr:23S rRNA (pseudouridine(1915)-N(3))-methyltransferase RlmH [Taylorella asinigenitalis]CCG19964.1 ribosomal RNA large subunit methyltransferase H [Taylorella asinigenitalis 14/45]